MALTYTKSGKVAGKAEDLLNLSTREMLTLNRDELAKVVSKLGNVFNKRLPRLEKEGSRAATNVIEGGGKFQAKGKNLNELRKEYARIKAFADDKSATVRGTIQIRKDLAERLSVKTKNAEDVKNLWKAYNRLEKELGAPFNEIGKFIRELDSNQVQRDIAKELEKSKDIDEIIEKLKKQYTHLYEMKMKHIKEEESREWSPI